MKIYEIEKFKCYEVSEPDGGGYHHVHIAYFSTKSVAEEYIKSSDKGWPKDVREKCIFHRYIVLDSVEEMDTVRVENLRKSALSKLTPDEIRALGL
jgi:hypothetical protein